MALPVISVTDFTGYLNISADTYVSNDLTEYIDRYYPYYVRLILSDAIYIAMRDNSPIRQKYLDLMNGIDYDNTLLNDSVLTINNGLVNVIKHILYYEFVSDNFVNTNTGNVRNFNENSDLVVGGDNIAIVQNRYNRGIKLLREEVYIFLCNYAEIKTDIDSFIDNGGGSYTINTTSTLYLLDGDTVVIDGIDYVISGLVANTSFDILGSIGLDFTGATFDYKPYEGVNMPDIKTVFA